MSGIAEPTLDDQEDEEEMFQRLYKEGLKTRDKLKTDGQLMTVPKFYSKVRLFN